MNTTARRVMVIGLDGATWDVLTPLASLGVMPNLAHLMSQAALAELDSTAPCITPVAWTTFQTGCDPARHGVLDFRWLDHAQRRLRFTDVQRISCPTLLEHVAAAGGTTVSINLPMTHGAGRPGEDLIVGGLEAPSAAEALAKQPRLRAQLEARGVTYPLDAVWKHRPTTWEQLQQGVQRTQAAFRSRTVAAQVADQLTDWQLMMVQFQALDPLQHRCWHLLGTTETPLGPPAWINEVQQALRTLDESIGELLELAEHRGAAVVLLSDHGFGPFREKISVVELLRRRGLLRLPTRAGRVGYRLQRTLWKSTRWAQRHFGSNGKVANLPRPLEALLPVDWKQSSAVACHGNLAAMIYLNTPERFGSGPVTSSSQRAQVTADVIATLQEARHPETDERLFTSAFSVAEAYGCDPVHRNLPDVMGIPADGFHTRHKFDRTGMLIRQDASLTGTHRSNGVLLLSAPGVRGGEHHRAHIRDVAPTILHLLGIQPTSSMDGVRLDSLLATAATEPRLIVSSSRQRVNDAAFPERISAALAGSLREEQLVEQRLRDLGYIE